MKIEFVTDSPPGNYKFNNLPFKKTVKTPINTDKFSYSGYFRLSNWQKSVSKSPR
jgi:hypothetical protein